MKIRLRQGKRTVCRQTLNPGTDLRTGNRKPETGRTENVKPASGTPDRKQAGRDIRRMERKETGTSTVTGSSSENPSGGNAGDEG